jgi:hypothetical protein
MRTAPVLEESETPGLEVGAEPPPVSDGFGRRAGAFLLREFREILPPTIVFLIGFNLSRQSRNQTS